MTTSSQNRLPRRSVFSRSAPALTAVAQAWTKPYEELLASPALAALANRAAVQDGIIRAHVTFFDVRGEA